MDLIDRMKNGDYEAIKEGLYHKGALVRVNSLIFASRNHLYSPMFISRAKELTKDETCLFGHNGGHKVSDFAAAFLHLAGKVLYSGNRRETKELIDSKMVF